MTKNNEWDSSLPVKVSRGGRGIASQTGFLVGNGTNAMLARSLISGAGINITNGSGVSGNPTISLTGGLILVSSQSASSSASIDFTNLDANARYFLVYNRVILGTNAQTLVMQYSVDNGSNWEVTNYFGANNQWNYNSATVTNVNDTTQWRISALLSNARYGSGEVWISTGTFCHMEGHCISLVSSEGRQAEFFGLANNASAVNAIRVLSTSGTIGSGSFKLYKLT